MKKIIFGVLVVLAASSCTTLRKTATTMDVDTRLYNRSTADLVVSPEKISYNHYVPAKKIRRAGMQNAKNAAVSELLKQHGDADVLVHAQFETAVRRGFFGQKKIKYISVSGYPAHFKNFQTTNDKPCEK